MGKRVLFSDAWKIVSKALNDIEEEVCPEWYTDEGWGLIDRWDGEDPNFMIGTDEILSVLDEIIGKIGRGHPEHGQLKTNYSYFALHAMYRARQRVEKLAYPNYRPDLSWDYGLKQDRNGRWI